MKTKKITRTIDCEVTANQLIETFINGNRKDAINALKNDHPGLTALFFYIACRKLPVSDMNWITNSLIEDRMELAQSYSHNSCYLCRC